MRIDDSHLVFKEIYLGCILFSDQEKRYCRILWWRYLVRLQFAVLGSQGGKIRGWQVHEKRGVNLKSQIALFFSRWQVFSSHQSVIITQICINLWTVRNNCRIINFCLSYDAPELAHENLILCSRGAHPTSIALLVENWTIVRLYHTNSSVRDTAPNYH